MVGAFLESSVIRRFRFSAVGDVQPPTSTSVKKKNKFRRFVLKKKDVSNDADVVSNCFNFNEPAFCFLVSSQEKENKSDFPTRLSKTQWSLSQRNHPLQTDLKVEICQTTKQECVFKTLRAEQTTSTVNNKQQQEQQRPKRSLPST